MNIPSIKKGLSWILIISIGVSVSLTFSHWNKSNREKKSGLTALLELKTELTSVRQHFDRVVHSHIKVKEASVDLMKLLSKDDIAAHLDEIDRLDLMVRRVYHFNYPDKRVLMNIQKSNAYPFVDDSLRILLNDWPGLVGIYQEKEDIVEDFYHDHFLPYLMDEIPLAEQAGETAKMRLYSSMKYKNLVVEKMELVIHVLFDGQVVKNYTDDLITRIDQELDGK